MNDDEVEARLRDALRQFAGDAPPGVSMLSTVTTESARRGRRVRLAALASGAAALVAIGAAVPFALRGAPPAVVAAPSSPAPASPAPAPSTPAAPSAPASFSARPATLVAATVPPSLVFPVTPPTGDGYGTPMISLTADRLTLSQTLPTTAPVTVTAYDSPPPSPAGQARTTPAEVAGRPATVYEWSRSDDDRTNPDSAPRVSLVWHPSARTWLRLDADGGTAVPLLVAYAEALKPGGATAETPFTFTLMPSGWTVDDISPAVVTFAPPGTDPDAGYLFKLVVQLDEEPGRRPKLEGPATVGVRVGDRQAWLTTTPEVQFLQIPVDGGRSLMLQVSPAAALPQDVLLRFAAGIGVTPSAQVSHG
ncbi:hypothetical protein ACQP1P_04365 [Dactylosporangium sp. CA-052675]|uniref:hypothetical protein n=1 Tax=Dactylosporangium sp. CA-052675 TaxID=3239927 RepID=UPI003D91FA7B